MAETTRKFDLVLNTTYAGDGVKSADADLQKLRENASLPITGAIDKEQIQRIINARSKVMQEAGDRARLNELANEEMFGKKTAQKELSEADFNRSRSSRLPRRLTEGSEEKTLSQQSRGLQRAFRLYGAVAIADQVGASLQKLPAAVDKFYDDMRQGATKTEAFANVMADIIPGAGELGKGLNAAYSAFHDILNPNEAKQRRQREFEQDQRDERTKMAEKRDAGRQAIMLGGKSVADSANYSLKTAGLSGEALDYGKARADYDEQIRKLNEQYNQGKGKLAPEQLEQFQKDIERGKAAAQAELNDKIAAMDRDRARRTEADAKSVVKWNKEANEAILSDRRSALHTEMEMEGYFYDSKAQAINESLEDTLKKIDEEKDAQIEALREDFATGKTKSFVTDDADARAKRRKDAAIDAAQKERESLDDENNKARMEETYDFQQKEFDAHSNQRERLQRLKGDAFAADRERLVRERSDRLSQIDKEQRENTDKHKERAGEYQKRADEQREDAEKDFQIGTLEGDIRRGMMFRSRPTNTTPEGDNRLLTGVGGQIKQGGIDREMLDRLDKLIASQEKMHASHEKLYDAIKGSQILRVPESN